MLSLTASITLRDDSQRRHKSTTSLGGLSITSGADTVHDDEVDHWELAEMEEVDLLGGLAGGRVPLCRLLVMLNLYRCRFYANDTARPVHQARSVPCPASLFCRSHDCHHTIHGRSTDPINCICPYHRWTISRTWTYSHSVHGSSTIAYYAAKVFSTGVIPIHWSSSTYADLVSPSITPTPRIDHGGGRKRRWK